MQNYLGHPNEFGTYNIDVVRDEEGFHFKHDKLHEETFEEDKRVYIGPLHGGKNYSIYPRFAELEKERAIFQPAKRDRSRSPVSIIGNKSTGRMTNDVEEIEGEFKDVLSTCKIKTTDATLKMDDFIKTFSGGKGSSLEEKLKAVDNLTTCVPLNGKRTGKKLSRMPRMSSYIDGPNLSSRNFISN